MGYLVSHTNVTFAASKLFPPASSKMQQSYLIIGFNHHSVENSKNPQCLTLLVSLLQPHAEASPLNESEHSSLHVYSLRPLHMYTHCQRLFRIRRKRTSQPSCAVLAFRHVQSKPHARLSTTLLTRPNPSDQQCIHPPPPRRSHSRPSLLHWIALCNWRLLTINSPAPVETSAA